MGEPAQARLHPAQDHRDPGEQPLHFAGINDRGAVGAVPGLAAGGIHVVPPDFLVGGIIGDHRIEVAGSDAEKEARRPQPQEIVVFFPIGLRDDADRKPVRFEITADEGRAETGVVDIGVAGNENDIKWFGALGGRQKLRHLIEEELRLDLGNFFLRRLFARFDQPGGLIEVEMPDIFRDLRLDQDVGFPARALGDRPDHDVVSAAQDLEAVVRLFFSFSAGDDVDRDHEVGAHFFDGRDRQVIDRRAVDQQVVFVIGGHVKPGKRARHGDRLGDPPFGDHHFFARKDIGADHRQRDLKRRKIDVPDLRNDEAGDLFAGERPVFAERDLHETEPADPERFERFRADPGGQQGAGERAGTDPGDIIDRDVVFFEDLDDADVRQAARGAARQR